jgi:hypothetical protein
VTVPTNHADALAQELARRRRESILKLQRSDPQHNPRASNIHDCARNIAYQVLDWEKKKPFDEWLLARFEEGRRQEKAVIDEIRADGFDVIDQDVNGQLTIAVPEQNGAEFRRGEVLTGRIDGMIKWEGQWLPLEVKSLNPNIFNSVKSLEDFSKKPIFRRYLRQMQVYLFGRNAEQGLFALSDCLGHRIYLPVYLDYGEAEWILQHLERAARAIKKREYPDRIPYDSELCGKCQFAHICLPDVINAPAAMIDNPALEADLDRHEQIKELASEYRELHDKIKNTFEGIEKAVVGGRFLVQNVPSKRVTYEIPAEIEAEIQEMRRGYAKAVPVTRLMIQPLDGQAK